MAKAKKVKQLSFTMENRVGLLSEITIAIADAKVNIEAICAKEFEDKASFMLIADSVAKAKKILAKLGIEICEEDVMSCEMPNKAGELQKVAKKIADAGIDINYMYGTAGGGKSSICIFKTADDKKAIKIINNMK